MQGIVSVKLVKTWAKDATDKPVCFLVILQTNFLLLTAAVTFVFFPHGTREVVSTKLI